jgi:chemotaxis protein methyltransferase CheR
VTDKERRGLREAIAGRMAALKLSSEMEYLKLIELDIPSARYEWDELVLLITNNESYFFRDGGQMKLLREVILPELIERRRPRRTLRVWSVGCSTGEEAYSVAIMLAELLPDRSAWDLAIVGTDINARAISRARQGLYGAWSFRMVDPDVRARYFIQDRDAWAVRPDIRSMVSFRIGNMTRDVVPFDPSWHHGFDLIICRNVFIYFERSAVRSAVARFAGALADGGYLMTGHGELGPGDLAGLVTRRFPASIVYQAGEIPSQPPSVVVAPLVIPVAVPAPPVVAPPVVAPPVVAPPVVAPPTAAPPVDVASIEALIDRGEYAAAIERCREALGHDATNAGLLALLGSAHAHRGEYDPALRASREAVAIDPLMEEPYYTLAQIAEERGDREGARKLYNDILYIAPGSVAARLHLADIMAGDDDERGAVLRGETMEILAGMSPEAHVRHYGEATVEELLAYLRGLDDGNQR